MFIERIVVEEGFLDGLALDLSPGLNVVIGARGTGKTSLVELIRFALDARAFQEAIERKSKEQVQSVLGRGRVTLTVNLGGESFQVSRSAGDAAPRSTRPIPPGLATVLSQTEIELIADDAAGRLRLLDGFVSALATSDEAENRATSRVRSLTRQMLELTERCGAIEEQVAAMLPIEQELLAAEAEQTGLLVAVEAHEPEKKLLEELGAELETLTARERQADAVRSALTTWAESLRDVVRAGTSIAPAAADDASPVISLVSTAVVQASDKVEQAVALVDEAVAELDGLNLATSERYHQLADKARTTRRSLDQAVKGAGAITARVATLREQLASKPDLVQDLESLRLQSESIRAERALVLDELDELREKRFTSRAEAAEHLNTKLKPAIRVELVRYGSQSNYSAAIAEALRGTRLHYNQLSLVLAAALSPRELVEAAEANDVESVKDVAGVDSERAGRVLQALRENGGADILAARLEDAVEFLLLDGADFKPSGSLSTGQRCTVVLPMLLEQTERLIVIDQPEDHLDNSFIVETVVNAIRTGKTDAQRIIATHNANIPVLGDADLVVSLVSDGRNGFIDAAGPLDTPAVVGAITTVMEGGIDAFERRARFYSQVHSAD